MPELDGPLEAPPEVVIVDGEVLLVGERVSVAYTEAAARGLAERLDVALRNLSSLGELNRAHR